MKLNKLLLATSLVALTVASCNTDDVINSGADVQFSSVIGSQAHPMATGTQWTANDRIGVYMKVNGSTLSTGAIVDGAENVAYVTESGNGTFSPVSLEKAIKMPNDGSAVDFIAYYPYLSTITSFTYPVNVENQNTPEAIDLLYSNQATAKDKSNPNVTLNFKHRLTKLVFNVKAGEGISSLSGLTTKVSGLKTQANFSLVDGSLSLNTTSKKDMVLKSRISEEGIISEGIVLPDSDLGEVKATFTLPVVGSFNATLPNNVQFEGGKIYTFNVELKDNGDVTSITLAGTIEDWISNPAQDITIEKGEAIGDGTEAEPYNIKQLSGKIGESAKWTQGYVVSIPSYVSSDYILLALSAGETDAAKCVAVQLVGGSEIQASLDIVAHPSLVGTKVMVKGDIAANIVGLAVGITSVTAQKGGFSAEAEVFYSETFGTASVTSKPKLNAYTGWDVKTVTYSGVGDIRSTSTFDNHVWLPVGDANLKIENISTSGLSNIKLTYSITANVFSASSTINIDKLQVKCDGASLPVPNFVLTNAYQNAYYTVTIENLPEGFTTLEFVTTAADNTLGFRLDNVKLEGTR